VIETEIAQKVFENMGKLKMKQELEIASTERHITEKMLKTEKNRNENLKAQKK